MVDYDLSKSNLCICDSYKVRKCKMKSELLNIKNDAENDGFETDVFKRSMFSLKMEWIFHNFLYIIGYKRERTKDTDLDNPCDHPEWLYITLGLLVWLFVW